MDQSRTQKADVIAYALKKCEIKDKKRAVMVGDREHDIIGAKIKRWENTHVRHIFIERFYFSRRLRVGQFHGGAPNRGRQYSLE